MGGCGRRLRTGSPQTRSTAEFHPPYRQQALPRSLYLLVFSVQTHGALRNPIATRANEHEFIPYTGQAFTFSLVE